MNNNQEKIDALVECMDHLSNALYSFQDIDEEAQRLTETHWEIKDAQSTIEKYIRELSK
jgi:xylose isomerase